MPGEDLLETFDRLADLVRHPALTLDLFTTEPLDDYRRAALWNPTGS